MALHKISVDVTLTEINCGECGGTYAINERYRQQKYEEGASWNCPYCRTGWGYAENNENSRLKKELEQEKKRREWAQQAARNAEDRAGEAERRRIGQKAATTRLKKRIGAGVCPCCKRTVKQLREHMEAKHPNYAAPEGVS